MVKLDNIHNYFIVLLLFTITINHSISYAISAIILVLWFVNGDLKQRVKVFFSDRLGLSFLALFALHLVGLLWSEDLDDGLKILSKQKIYIFAPILISFFDRRFVKYALSAFLAAMFISEIYSLYLYLNDDIHLVGSLPSPFMHHMHYSLILAFTFGYLVSEIDFKNILQKRELFYLLFAMLTIVVLFINKGRVGQIAILPVLFILALGKFRLSFLKSIVTVIVSSLVLFLVAYNLSEQFKVRFDKASYEFSEVVGTGKRDSIACRFEMWDYATKLGSDNIALGIGTGDSIKEMNHLLGKDGFDKLFSDCGLGLRYEFNPHNNFILFFMLFGIVGLIALVAILTCQFKIANEQRSLPMVILLTVTTIGMLTASPISMHIKYMFFYAFVLSMLYLDSLESKTP
jgi:O-antigen ligase